MTKYFSRSPRLLSQTEVLICLLSRLNVLRAIITETSNASKGNSPIKTDIQVLSMLRKRTAASKTAAHEFAEAKRDDLKQKQEAEIAVLDEYAGQVETVSDEEITQAIDEVFNPVDGSGSKPNSGLIMKELLKPGGRLQGKAVDKTRVAEMIKKKLS